MDEGLPARDRGHRRGHGSDPAETSAESPSARDDVPWDRPTDFEQPTDTTSDSALDEVAEANVAPEPAWDRPGVDEAVEDPDPADATDDAQPAPPMRARRPSLSGVASAAAARLRFGRDRVADLANDPDDAYAPVLDDVSPLVARAWQDTEAPDQATNRPNESAPRPVEPRELAGRGLGPTPPDDLFLRRPTIWTTQDTRSQPGRSSESAARFADDERPAGETSSAEPAAGVPADDRPRSTTVDVEIPRNVLSEHAGGGASPLVLRIEVAVVDDSAHELGARAVQLRLDEAPTPSSPNGPDAGFASPPRSAAISHDVHAAADERQAASEPVREPDPLTTLRGIPAPPSELTLRPPAAASPAFAPPPGERPDPRPMFASATETSTAAFQPQDQEDLDPESDPFDDEWDDDEDEEGSRNRSSLKMTLLTISFGVAVVVLALLFLRLMTDAL